MVYEVPASKRSLKQNVFEFKVPGSTKVYSIPKAEFLTMGQVETLQQKEDEVSLTDVLDLIGDATAQKAARGLDQHQLKALLEAWQKESGLELGESSASS